uniref:Uncharacterized protein n=1 Tax=Anguilla anguilla TaxID=7936 RepID=A0A0E9WB05_ANGAN
MTWGDWWLRVRWNPREEVGEKRDFSFKCLLKTDSLFLPSTNTHSLTYTLLAYAGMFF